MTTEKQLAANRANAKKSTGPRTARGKERASLNALKHGILARCVIPAGLATGEDPAEFEALLDRLCQDLAPVGAAEEMLVQVIAACYWRLGRLLRAEGGAIALALRRAEADAVARDEELSEVTRILDELERALRSPKALHDYLAPGHLYEHSAAEDRREASRKQQKLRQRQRAAEADDPVARLDRAALPAIDDALAFTRYEAQLHRQLHRSLHQLERLQRRRLGEAVPPPLALDITVTPAGGLPQE